MAVQNLRRAEWEFVWDNYHLVPPVIQEYFEEVAETKHIEDWVEFEGLWNAALGVIKFQHEEAFFDEVKRSKDRELVISTDKVPHSEVPQLLR